MARDFAAELDQLKKDVEEIKKLLKSKKDSVPLQRTRSSTMPPEAQKQIDELRIWAEETGNQRGVVSYKGFHYSSGRESHWAASHCTVKELLAMPQDKVATVFSALGNQQRLDILLALLEQPMTVAQLVEKLQMKTTGQAYHHLNSLIAADLLEEVKEAEKGTYAVKGHRVQGIIMALVGVNDLIDITYSSGNWE